MITPHDVCLQKTKEEVKEKQFWKEWVYNSHNWLELNPGHLHCKFCGMGWKSANPIPDDVKICSQNPYLSEIKIPK